MSSYDVPCCNKAPSSKDSAGMSHSVKTSSIENLDPWPFSVWPRTTTSVVSGATTRVGVAPKGSG